MTALPYESEVHEFLGGVRLTARSKTPLVPFAQVLEGGIKGSVVVSSTTTIPGGTPLSFSDSDSGTTSVSRWAVA